MSCCARARGLVKITEASQLVLLKPYKSITNDVLLNLASLSVKIFLVDLGYAKLSN